MSEKFVTVAQFSNYIDADLARQSLEGEGVKVVMTGENVASVYTGLPGISDVRLQTPESQAALAKEILDAWREQAQEIETQDFEPQDNGFGETGEEE